MKIQELKQLIKEEIESNSIPPNIVFAIHQYLSKKLDTIAIKNGDRMSQFSEEYPTQSSFYFDLKNNL